GGRERGAARVPRGGTGRCYRPVPWFWLARRGWGGAGGGRPGQLPAPCWASWGGFRSGGSFCVGGGGAGAGAPPSRGGVGGGGGRGRGRHPVRVGQGCWGVTSPVS